MKQPIELAKCFGKPNVDGKANADDFIHYHSNWQEIQMALAQALAVFQ